MVTKTGRNKAGFTFLLMTDEKRQASKKYESKKGNIYTEDFICSKKVQNSKSCFKIAINNMSEYAGTYRS